jgi:hypothetical protein
MARSSQGPQHDLLAEPSDRQLGCAGQGVGGAVLADQAVTVLGAT